MLPEHREMMERMKKQTQAHKPPLLSEDELAQMQYALQEALETEQQVRVTTYNPFGHRVYEGLPIAKENKLYVACEFGMMPLVIEEIVCLEIISSC